MAPTHREPPSALHDAAKALNIEHRTLNVEGRRLNHDAIARHPWAPRHTMNASA